MSAKTSIYGTVLLVDDNAVLVRLMQLAFRTFLPGVRLEVAEDGAEGLRALERLGGADLVLTDLMMPVMDGGTMVRRMQEDGRWAQIPVLIVSAMEQGRQSPLLSQPSVRGVLRKPLDPVTMAMRVTALLPCERLAEVA